LFPAHCQQLLRCIGDELVLQAVDQGVPSLRFANDAAAIIPGQACGIMSFQFLFIPPDLFKELFIGGLCPPGKIRVVAIIKMECL
jgi:hypothetical protein